MQCLKSASGCATKGDLFIYLPFTFKIFPPAWENLTLLGSCVKLEQKRKCFNFSNIQRDNQKSKMSVLSIQKDGFNDCLHMRVHFFLTVRGWWDRVWEIKRSWGSVYQDAAKEHKLKMIFGAGIQEPTLQSRLIHTQRDLEACL